MTVGRRLPLLYFALAHLCLLCAFAAVALVPSAVAGFYRGLPGLWASIHCAGGFAMSPVAETSLEDWQRLMALNLTSAFVCCREAAAGGPCRRCWT